MQLESGDETFVSRVVQQCAHDAGWTIELPRGPDYPYIVVSHVNAKPPSQGWKLHLSADEFSADAILERALPVLASAQVAFKVLGSVAWLRQLNGGSAGLSQVGKFLTVYPDHDKIAVRLAHALHVKCQDIIAPGIPSDKPIAPSSVVHYRYGAFSFIRTQTPLGLVVPAIRTPGGNLAEDVRGTTYFQPDWVTCPFEDSDGALREPQVPTVGRYVLLRTIGRSARFVISLALDKVGLRLCVVKGLNDTTCRGRFADSVQATLRAEADLLTELYDERGFPRIYDFVNSDSACFVVLEDVDGTSLSSRVAAFHADGKRVPIQTVAKWGGEIANILDVLHQRNYVYGDLKPTNVLVSDAHDVTLIDFESCLKIGAQASRRISTRGYRSAAAREGAPPLPEDDLYSLGMLLAYLVTGIEPSLLPNEVSISRRLMQAVPSDVPSEFVQLVDECLRPVDERGPTMAQVSQRLGLVSHQEKISLAPKTASAADGDDRGLSWHADVRVMAYRGMEELCRAAIPLGDAEGLAWLSRHIAGKGQILRGINTGVAGTILALSQMVDIGSSRKVASVLRSAARYLVTAPLYGGSMHPGLYVGEAGVAVALLRAGQVLQDAYLIERAVAHSRRLPEIPHSSPDLFNGTAGRARCHLLQWSETKAAEDLEYAIQAGDAILAAAQHGHGGASWVIPSGYGGLTGKALLGYAHGAAGIGDSLLDLYEATGDQRFLEGARWAMNWLLTHKRDLLEDSSVIAWPTVPGAENAPPYWCQGSVGIGRFFLHAARLGEGDESRHIATSCASAAARYGIWQGPTLCHGIAGAIEFLVDAAQVLDAEEHLAEAFELARYLENFTIESENGNLVWCSESPTTITPDYMVGYAGVIACLAKLSQSPEKQRHGLYPF